MRRIKSPCNSFPSESYLKLCIHISDEALLYIELKYREVRSKPTQRQFAALDTSI